MKSFISREVFDGMRPKQELEATHQRCFGITGEQLQVEGTVQATLSFPSSGSFLYAGKFFISGQLFQPLQCVLGWDFLTSNALNLLYKGQGAYVLAGRHGETPLTPKTQDVSPLPSADKSLGCEVRATDTASCLLAQSSSRGPVNVTLSTSLCIPSRTEVLVNCQLPKSYKDQLGMVTPIQDDSPLSASIFPAYSVSQAEGRHIPVRLMNCSNIDIELQAGQKVSEFCPLVESPVADDTPECFSPTSMNMACTTSVSDIQGDLENALSPSLSPPERCTLLETLMQYSDVFDPSLGHTTVITHKIDTGDAAPIRQYPRRLPYAYREETDKQVSEMLQQGVIKPSNSPWASPVVLVKKKDGTFRFCIDYRKLNAITKKDAHPLPRVDDLLDALQGSCMFSTLDLRSGYWQVSMDPQDQHKTAFVTPSGLWEFQRMPFGVSNGCATFQRAIEIVLSGLTYETCLCYFDDVIVPSSNLQQQCERLALVLERFRKHNLRVKATKCTFGANKVNYLGHVVSAKGVHTDPDKIKAVSLLAEPQNVEQVRSFLGLAGYYRKFIPKFAMLAAPLVSLTKKGTKFHWSKEHSESFLVLKDLLCQAPVLAYPRFDHPFVLQTDASDLGLGAVLTQIDADGNERVISYASRPLTDREKGYSATEKEALAVVFATDYYRVYLLGKHFTLITDHSALRWLHSVEPKGRIARWVMDLQEYTFDVRHRPGTANQNADALSRLPQDVPSYNCATTMTPGYNLQQAQLDDPTVSKIIEMKLSGQPKPPYFVWSKDPALRVYWHCWDDLFITNGLLVKDLTVDKSCPNYAFVIPTNMIESVLTGIHSSPFSGYLGVKRTVLRARSRFYWPRMVTKISDFVRNCPLCAQSKLDPNHKRAPLQSIEVNEPFVFWAMDYMGPLPETSRGNKHLLVVMDHFTKWCEVFATTDQKAQTVAEILVSRVFSRFGPPTVLHSDQGRNFESNLMKEVCNLMGIHKSRTTAYHPQCDGQVERQNRTLQDMLSAFVSQNRDDWDLWVDLAVYAYNTSTHESTGYSPYELVFGRVARTPVEVDLGIPLKHPASQTEYSESVRQHLHSVQKVAQEHLEQSRLNQKATGLSSAKWRPLAVGQSVWLRRPKTWKFGKRWVGPYKIQANTGVNYTIRSKEGKDMVVHHNNVKACSVPFDKGETFCPVKESGEVEFLPGGIGSDRENVGVQMENEDLQPFQRPARLRQVVRPPLRFGDFVTH